VPTPVAILGGGSRGTALAWLMGQKGYAVTHGCRDPQQVGAIQRDRRNLRYLPDLELPATVTPEIIAPSVVAEAEICIMAVPLQQLRGVLESVAPHLAPAGSVVLVAKGLETGTGQRGSEVALDVGGADWAERLAVLSGPNLAGELARSIPSTSVIAAWNGGLARRLQEVFGTPFFRVYTNQDVTGVELGGALKNPVAIAAGISDGLGFGNNTKAALITRGLAEMTRLGCAAGGQSATFAGLSGLGDLVATCGSPLSRNYRLGIALGQGAALDEALVRLGQVAEGVPTAAAACALAARLGVELPITAELGQVLFHEKPPLTAVTSLMTREFRGEAGDDG
jgi:glycerol-3-phosphate dehydrogenase (NAD(P)+)